MSHPALVIREVEIEGRAGLDVRIEDGRIAEIGPKLPRAGDEIDGHGGALIPGLIDHHIHLFALAAQAQSVALDGVTTAEQLRDRIAATTRAWRVSFRGASSTPWRPGIGCACSTRPARYGC
jgi:predicted amidohydrolase YtcJ